MISLKSSTLTCSFLVILLILYKAINLFRYVQQAKKTGLPYVLTWTLETETIGYVLTPILRWKYRDHLLKEEGWPRWCRLMIKDWSFEDKRRAHDEFGEVFLAVSPEGIICYACDAALGNDVMNRRNEFTKPRDKYSESKLTSVCTRMLNAIELLEIYGPNVTTTEGSVYRFHLRIVAPPFGETSGANDLVWNETKMRTRMLMSMWSKQQSVDFQSDINALTLAVIAKAGFGQDLDWSSVKGTKTAIPPGHKLSFVDAMTSTTHYMIPVLLLPRWLMYLSPLRHAAIAHSEFEKYVRKMIRDETNSIAASKAYESKSARGNLLTSILRASEAEAATSGKSTDLTRKQAFTETEVMGNLFLYLLAGYETTSNSMNYALITLALDKFLQNNVIAEIDRVYEEVAASGRTELTYADDFDKFEYTYGFMYETFRLFPAPQQITKTVTSPTTIHVSPPEGSPLASRPVLLPSECRVYLNVPATHHTPRYWPDPFKLEPQRWLTIQPHSSSSVSSSLSNELSTPDGRGKKVVAADRTRQMQGTFLTFSDGARACLGRKFAQAEYLAFLVTLLRGYRVELRADMDPEAVRREIYTRCKGTLTLAPLDNVRLVFKERC